MFYRPFLTAFSTALLVAALLSGCRTAPVTADMSSPSITSPDGTTPSAPEPFRVIGYLTGAAVLEMIQFDKLTHINYAFLIPKNDGTFQPLNNPWKLEKAVTLAHENGVKVFISVGGWGWDTQKDIEWPLD